MTTSNSTNFNLNRDQIIRGALRKIGAISSGETPDAQTVQDCSDALNALVKRWNAKGIHLWTESEGIVFLQPNQIQYALGSTSTDHATQSYVQTTLTTSPASGATTIHVASTSGMTASDYIGVILNSGSVYWTTITTVSSSTTLIIPALTDSSTTGNYVWTYTTPLLRPLRVPAGRSYNIVSAIDVPMIVLSRMDYRNLPNKTNTGVPTQFFYDPQLTNGQLYVWPAPINTAYAVKITWYRSIQDFDTAANTPDLPQEWLDTLIFNLAVVMAPEYDCPPQRFQMLVGLAANCLDDVTGWDREPESVFFGLNFNQR